ncbi:MAG: hypothetical protein GF383_09795 [Candidatus Lokiarchaeota archaeon]|nr:hypothetical protein [Candidatus Lokiarchaeota archaeon]MBD3340816.1 hypothetical protein [Candidatus Lokiarchaeota archaeon]
MVSQHNSKAIDQRIIPMTIDSIYKAKIGIIELFLEELLNQKLIQFIVEEYDSTKGTYFSQILHGTLDNESLKLLNIRLDLIHKRDRRTPYQYAIDLILGWIVEDSLIRFLSRSNDFIVQLSSSDRIREFLPNSKIESSSDLHLQKSTGKEIHIEVIKDYTGFWKEYNVCHLRDNKFQKIKEEAAYLLGVDLCSTTFFFSKIADLPMEHIPEHQAFGNKSACELKLDQIGFINPNELISLLVKI